MGVIDENKQYLKHRRHPDRSATTSDTKRSTCIDSDHQKTCAVEMVSAQPECVGRQPSWAAYGAMGKREVCWSTICHRPPILAQVTLPRVWYVAS